VSEKQLYKYKIFALEDIQWMFNEKPAGTTFYANKDKNKMYFLTEFIYSQHDDSRYKIQCDSKKIKIELNPDYIDYIWDNTDF
jgi:hypothetical protein